jgi:hypothetical protein
MNGLPKFRGGVFEKVPERPARLAGSTAFLK